MREDPVDLFVGPLKHLVRDTRSVELISESRRRFRDALADLVQGTARYGALKGLIDADDQARARLKLEAEVYESISDPHLLKILDKNVADAWIVTEYQPNGTLEPRLEEYKGQVAKTLSAIRPVVNVLAKMHTEGFTHRDVKPGNIFIGRTGELVLGDAGLVFQNQAERLTMKHENVGTRDYMPPWVQSRRAEIQSSFDIFAIGKVIHAMISGEPAPPGWYIHEEYSELTKLFPDDVTMHWANEVLDRCVGRQEEEIICRNGTDLLNHLDAVFDSLKSGCVPPTLVRQANRKCRICGTGHYVRLQRITLGNDSSGKPFALANQCNECGHVEFFTSQLPH